MTSIDIKQCKDIEKLRKLALKEYYQLAYISECLVDESKQHYSKEETIEFIRNYLVKHQGELDTIFSEE